MSVRRLPAVAAVLIAAAVLLAGCAATPDPEGGGDGLPTLSTTGPTPTADADALTAKYGTPPRERIDMSDADRDRALQPLNACVEDYTKKFLPPDERNLPLAKSDPQGRAGSKATAVCRPLEPKRPWEYDRQNPDAQRFLERVIDCMAAKGIPDVTISPDDGSGSYSVSFNSNVSKALELYPECEREASQKSTS